MGCFFQLFVGALCLGLGALSCSSRDRAPAGAPMNVAAGGAGTSSATGGRNATSIGAGGASGMAGATVDGGSSGQSAGGAGRGTAGAMAKGTGETSASDSGTTTTNAGDAGLPPSCAVPADIGACYQLNAPCTSGRFVFNAQNGTCDEVCRCTGAGTFDTKAACTAACIDAAPQSGCVAAGGSCTPDQYSACSGGKEPIYPQPKRDCSAGGHCCVAAPESACSMATSGSGECLLGKTCISPGLMQAMQACETGRVCCLPSTRGH